MKYDSLKLLKEYKGLIGRAKDNEDFTLRLYSSRFRPEDVSLPIEYFRYHFGFPTGLVKPLCPVLECTPYWGTTHWHETKDGFWLWHLGVIGKEPPFDELNREFGFFIRRYNMCLKFLGG